MITAKHLKEFLARVPDETPIKYSDPNFGGEYKLAEVEEWSIYYLLSDKTVYITFPCEEAVE